MLPAVSVNDQSCPSPLQIIQRGAQVRHSAAGARPSRRGTDAQHPGDLFEAEPPLMMEQQRFGLIGGQTLNTSADLVSGAEAVGFRKDGEFRQLLTGFMDYRPAPGRSPIHQENISRQTEHPGPNRVCRVVSGPRPVHLKKCLPAANRRRSASRQRDVTSTAAPRPRAARRFPEMLPAIRPDSGSSRREVVLLLRSLLELFAGCSRFVTAHPKKSLIRNPVTSRARRANPETEG